MRVQTLCQLILLFSLASCKSVAADSSLAEPTPSLDTTPVVIDTPQAVRTATLDATKISNYYGVWTITRYERPTVSLLGSDEFAESQIGKTMELTSTSIQFDHEFLWLEEQYCANTSYEWATIDQFSGHAWQMLLPSTNPENRDELLFFHVYCDGDMLTGFEVSRTGKLVAYLAGYWFFLDPEVSATSALATRFASTYTPTFTASPSPTITATALPTNTPGPGTKFPTATNTPTDLELLDERTQMLFGDPASVVVDFFLEIQDCVKTDNKEKLAGLILYPITIHSIDGKDVEIQSEEQFISNYEKIATPKWKGVILSQEPAKLFTNWQGIMVNRGEMWFGSVCLAGTDCQETKYYIYGITNDTPW